MKCLFLGTAIWVLTTLPATADTTFTEFGAPMPDAEKTLSLTAAIETGETTAHRMTGIIQEVCQKKGCFMVLAEGSHYARVTFQDYGFFVPKDSSGRNAVVYGTLTRQTLSKDEANHYETDVGRTGNHAGDVDEYSIVARSVRIF